MPRRQHRRRGHPQHGSARCAGYRYYCSLRGRVVGARTFRARAPNGWRSGVAADLAMLRETRPTAVNLMWALDVMAAACATIDEQPFAALLALAVRLHEQDLAANRAIGDFGAALIAPGSGVMTHCNAGALATAGYGTA